MTKIWIFNFATSEVKCYITTLEDIKAVNGDYDIEAFFKSKGIDIRWSDCYYMISDEETELETINL